MMSKQAQNGFTLIELIVVIVILGILAAVAIPKFVDFGEDARIANIKATAGAVQAAASMGYGAGALNGTDVTNSSYQEVNVKGVASDVRFVAGWPTASTEGIGELLVDAANDPNWVWTGAVDTEGGTVKFQLQDDCWVQYQAAEYDEGSKNLTPARVTTNGTTQGTGCL